MKRSTRPAVAVVAMALVSGGLAAFSAPSASAAVQGNVTVTPTTGTDQTLFNGSVSGLSCPAGTDDASFDIKGADIGELGDGTTSGSGAPGVLGAIDPPFTGTKTFSGASIANLKTTNSGSFSTSGAYRIRLRCDSAGVTVATYEAIMNYTAGGAGAYTIAPPATPARATATTLSATPAGPFELGTTTNLTADVTPTTGADNPTGSVEFFNGATSLGIDNTLTATGGANLDNVSLPAGSNVLKAVYTPADATFTASTSPNVTVSVTPVAARPTTAVLTVNPSSGAAYSPVTLSCAVSAATGNPNGTATFKDGATSIGTAPVTNGAPAVLVSSSFAPGAHPFSCEFAGTAPYNNSTSATVTATYDASAVTPDEQTVTVVIPQGALTITTPYTPAAPLALGTAVLDQATSTYSASAAFNGIVITDSRSGNLGWNASLVAGAFGNGTSTFGGDRAGLTGLVATQVPGNALQAANVTVTNNAPVTPGLGVPREFARYAAGLPIGTANLAGTFGIAGVPTSVTPGTYTSTVVFTAA